MRKFGLFLLLVTSAMPASAQRSDDGERQSHRSSKTEQSEISDNKPQRAERSERREAREQPPRQVQVERQQSGRQGNPAAVAAMRERHQQAQQQQVQEQVQQPQVQGESSRNARLQRYRQLQAEANQQAQGESSRNARLQRYRQRQAEANQQAQGESSRNARLQRYRQRQAEANEQTQAGVLVPRQSRIRTIPSTTPEAGQTGPVRHDVHSGRRVNRDGRHRWTNHWRNDRRYDWRRYRDRNRSVFRIGFYYDPFGYSYRRLGIGSFLYSNYYQSNYWIDDPWQYRLPPVYGPYRWVRYHNDALLIDIYSGEVVDVIYGFFW